MLTGIEFQEIYITMPKTVSLFIKRINTKSSDLKQKDKPDF